MDAVTHVLLAHVVALLAVKVWRSDRAPAMAAAAGAAALAPDLDVLLSPLTLFDSLYFLGHRGATHSIIGAPLSALAFLLILDRASRRFERLAIFRWQRGFWLAALWGGGSHLLLDVITRQGVVPFWPFSDARFSLEWFFYLIWWLAPISFLGMLQRYRGKWGERGYVRLSAVVVALIVVVGGVRLIGKPDGDHVYSTSSDLEWIVAEAHENGTWHLELQRRDVVLDDAWYEPLESPDAAIAITAARASLPHRAFLMDGTGPYVVRAEQAPGGWNVTIIDTVARFGIRDVPGFIPRQWTEDIGVFQATVTASGVQVHRAGR